MQKPAQLTEVVVLGHVVDQQIVVLASVNQRSAEVVASSQGTGKPLTKERIVLAGAFEVDQVQHEELTVKEYFTLDVCG